MEQPALLNQLAKQLGELLNARKISLATAESCTGGWLASVITSIPKSSSWFERGFVTYSNESKQELLKVNSSSLETFGAVSEQVAKEMAQGALNNSHAQISVSITGIAGPDKDDSNKPVGTVWFAWQKEGQSVHSRHYLFAGDRHQIRFESVKTALQLLIQELSTN